MKIALKYGIMITIAAMAWVIIVHWLVPNPASSIHSVGSGVFFNLMEIVGIYLGIKAKGREFGDAPTFKQGIKTGVSIAFVYALTACLFFAIVLLVIGPRMMAAEPGAQLKPTWQIAAGAFAGLFIGGVLFGLFYSAVISFLLAKRQSRSN